MVESEEIKKFQVSIESLKAYDQNLQKRATGATVHGIAQIRTRLQFLISNCPTCEQELCACDLYNNVMKQVKDFFKKR